MNWVIYGYIANLGHGLTPDLRSQVSYSFLANEMSRIDQLVTQIRELINEPRKRNVISQDDTDWFRLCSSLDIIGDSEIAFHAYEQMSDSDHQGSSYILVYGFLQALFQQQDAVKNLHEALQIPYQVDPLLLEIRKVRNAVAHPTDGGLAKEKEFRFISRVSLNKSGFELWRVVPVKGSREFTHVSLGSLLDKQHARVEHALGLLLSELRKEEMEYKERYKDESLEEVFPQSLGYYFEKIYQSARGGSSWQFGKMHVSLIVEVLDSFKSALDERQVSGAYSSIEYQLEILKYPLSELAKMFEEEGKGRLNSTDAEIFTKYIQNGVSKLQNMACEIDEEISSIPESNPD